MLNKLIFLSLIFTVLSQWTGNYDFVSTKTEQQLRRLAMLEPFNRAKTKIWDSSPLKWDSREVFNRCPTVSKIYDQGECGSCWAVSLANTLSDQFCSRNVTVELSPQDMVSCDKNNYGCDGGYLDNAWEYATKKGLVSEKCFPYSAMDEPCIISCRDGTLWKKYKSKSYRNFETLKDAMKHIMTYGSIQAGFNVYEDFFNYKSGVYYHKKGDLVGGHAIVILGWGSSNGTKFWIGKNSWGEKWGDKGFFMIKRGNDECNIESNLWSGIPSV